MAAHSGATEGLVEDDDAASHQLHHNATDDDDNTVVVATTASAAAESELVATQSVCGRKLHRTVEIVQQQHYVFPPKVTRSLPLSFPLSVALCGWPNGPAPTTCGGPLPRRAFPLLRHIDVAGGTLDGTVLLWENVVTGGTNCVETTSVLRAYAPGNLKLSADNGFGLAGHGGWVVHGGVIGEMTIWDLRTLAGRDRACAGRGDSRIATGDCAGVVKE
ncbi:hypothetical protein DFJ73DRAFT_776554 [Zopfochytrium polystomum]|nr:hypothetical protein DFJ73DRAFT_776554 [Zopfochytrium polystomum]